MIKKNITFRLTIGFLAIVIVSTLFIGIIALNIFKNNIYEVKKNNMKKHAIAISKTIEPYLRNDIDSKEFVQMIHLLDDIDNAKVWILKTDNSILTASDTDKDIKYINESEIKDLYSDINTKVLEGKEAYDEGYNPYYNDEMMIIAVPIKNNSKVIGAVILNSSILDLSKSMDKFFQSLIFAILAEILIVGLLGYYFSRNISKPIKKINSSALELARGHYGIKTNIYQKDEIGELSSSFDLLSLKLKYTISELFEEKNKLSNIIKSMSEGILALDKKFQIININEGARNLLDKSIKNNIGVINVLLQLGVIEEFKTSIANGEKRILTKNHKNKVLNLSISPIKNNLNEIIGGVILVQDISVKEKLEQMRKDFISNVSHEFRTPLTVIKGNLESIIDGITKPEHVIDTCVTLIKETNRLERMVKELLNLSKLESGKIELDLSELDVNMLISDTARSFRTLMSSKDIDLQLDLKSNLPTLLSDYDKLKQMLIIFLDNAIKFSYPRSILKVTTYSDNKNIYIKVEDNGIGIPKEEIEYLGEKFFKADKSRNANVEGTGLGLSIARRLVKVLKGNFNIESDLGKGTTITISFSIMET